MTKSASCASTRVTLAIFGHPHAGDLVTGAPGRVFLEIGEVFEEILLAPSKCTASSVLPQDRGDPVGVFRGEHAADRQASRGPGAGRSMVEGVGTGDARTSPTISAAVGRPASKRAAAGGFRVMTHGASP
ncbi:MAG: hypothetical protein R3D59_11635 [Paracoccaceae bacterium]